MESFATAPSRIQIYYVQPFMMGGFPFPLHPSVLLYPMYQGRSPSLGKGTAQGGDARCADQGKVLVVAPNDLVSTVRSFK